MPRTSKTKKPPLGGAPQIKQAPEQNDRADLIPKKAQKKNLHAEVLFVFDGQTIICQHLQTELLLVLRRQRVPGQQLQG